MFSGFSAWSDYMLKRKRAKVTLELSLMVGILVVIVLAALTMFGNGLREVVANSGFTKHALNQETLANKQEIDSYTATQETIEVAGAQGNQIIASLERMNAGLSLIGTDKSQLFETQLQEIYKALLVANMTKDVSINSKISENIKPHLITEEDFKEKYNKARALYDIKLTTTYKDGELIKTIYSNQGDILASAKDTQTAQFGESEGRVEDIIKAVYK